MIKITLYRFVKQSRLRIICTVTTLETVFQLITNACNTLVIDVVGQNVTFNFRNAIFEKSVKFIIFIKHTYSYMHVANATTPHVISMATVKDWSYVPLFTWQLLDNS